MAVGPLAGSRTSGPLDRRGIVPPDVAELRWGAAMGVEEVNAYEAKAAMLEVAVAAGRLRRGSAGWRTCQAELARAYLTAADPALDGASRLDRIRAELFGAWASSRGDRRRRSVSAMLARLASPGGVPSDARDPAAAHDGLRLNLWRSTLGQLADREQAVHLVHGEAGVVAHLDHDGPPRLVPELPRASAQRPTPRGMRGLSGRGCPYLCSAAGVEKLAAQRRCHAPGHRKLPAVHDHR